MLYTPGGMKKLLKSKWSVRRQAANDLSVEADRLLKEENSLRAQAFILYDSIVTDKIMGRKSYEG